MDCHMPEMDGLETTRAIRAREKPRYTAAGAGSRHLPVLALTADVLPENQTRCREAGMDDFLTKPVRKEHLREVLGRWLPD